MAKQAQSQFLQKAVLAHEQHKADDTKAGRGGELPGGIDNGIAELVSLKIGIYAKGDSEGEPFFMGMATCRSPKVHNGLPIAGLFTTAGPIGLCDTTNAKGEVTPFADNWDRMLRHLRSLGLDTKDLSPHDIISGIDAGAYETGPILLALAGAAPKFRFRTNSAPALEQMKDGKWKVGRKFFGTKEAALSAFPYAENPRVWHEWGDVVEWNEEGTSAVQDDTVQEAKWESDDKAETAAGPAEMEGAAEDRNSDGTTSVPAAVESVATEDLPDFLAVALVADNPKTKKPEKIAAEKVLCGYAETLGIEGYKDMPSWTEVAVAIQDMVEIQKAEQAGGEPEATAEAVEEEEYSDEPEDWKPVKGELGFFFDPKTKENVKCEFVEVSAKLEKVDLKRLDNNKIVKGVPFVKVSATSIPF